MGELSLLKKDLRVKKQRARCVSKGKDTVGYTLWRGTMNENITLKDNFICFNTELTKPDPTDFFLKPILGVIRGHMTTTI